MILKINKIIEAINGKIMKEGDTSPSCEIKRVITDTRLFKDGEDYADAIFVAIVGEKFDANDFIYEADRYGVAAIITSLCEIDAAKAKGACYINVPDTLPVLGIIGRLNRELFAIKTVGVTGSVGKTTTKEIIYHVLSENMPTKKTDASFNNEIGVPRTLMSLDDSYKAFVCEMGMRGFGQVEFLASCALPEIGVITNIGTAHLEIMGTKENTLKAKLEIAKYASKIILNGDDPLLSDKEKVAHVLKEYGKTPEIIYFGLSENCDCFAKIKTMEAEKSIFTVSYKGEEFEVNLCAPGIHNVTSALSAVCVAKEFGLSNEQIKEALESFKQEQTGRQKIIKTEKITIIDDCFNACPESMKASISLLKALKGDRKVAFLGDMLELGENSAEEHRGVGEFAAKEGINLIVTVGSRAKELGLFAARAEKGTCVIALDDSNAAKDAVKELIKPGDVILVKGSHAMQMDCIVKECEKEGL